MSMYAIKGSANNAQSLPALQAHTLDVLNKSQLVVNQYAEAFEWVNTFDGDVIDRIVAVDYIAGALARHSRRGAFGDAKIEADLLAAYHEQIDIALQYTTTHCWFNAPPQNSVIRE